MRTGREAVSGRAATGREKIGRAAESALEKTGLGAAIVLAVSTGRAATGPPVIVPVATVRSPVVRATTARADRSASLYPLSQRDGGVPPSRPLL